LSHDLRTASPVRARRTRPRSAVRHPRRGSRLRAARCATRLRPREL